MKIEIYAAEEAFFESRVSRDLGSKTGGLQVKFWQTRATTLSAEKLFLAISAMLLLLSSQTSISSSLVGSICIICNKICTRM